MTRPFKGPVTILGRFGGKSTIKTEYNLKYIRNYSKNNLANNFFRNINMYFKQQK